MKKVTQLVLMLCLILSGALCYARGIAGTENEKGSDGTPIVIIRNSIHSGSEKGNTIISMINGHVLTVVFTENLGQVTIEVTTVSGNPVTCMSTYTPNGVILYVTNIGDYIITFTLPNGDEYYGEFTVTD